MKRPEITPENYAAVFEHFGNITPDPRALRAIAWLAAEAYNPIVCYEPGAHAAIAEQRAKGNAWVQFSNHTDIRDQFAVAAGLYQDPLLKPFLDKYVIMAKAGYMQAPHKYAALNWLQRLAFERLGAMPVQRPDEIPDNISLLQANSEAMITALARRSILGQTVYVFPEGSRNQGDLSELLPIKSGPGRVAWAVQAERPVSLMPISIWPGQEQERHFSPILYFGTPLEGPFSSHREATSCIRELMVAGVAEAESLSALYAPIPPQSRRQLVAQQVINKLLAETK